VRRGRRWVEQAESGDEEGRRKYIQIQDKVPWSVGRAVEVGDWMLVGWEMGMRDLGVAGMRLWVCVQVQNSDLVAVDRAVEVGMRLLGDWDMGVRENRVAGMRLRV
jgi:hypothetical protein